MGHRMIYFVDGVRVNGRLELDTHLGIDTTERRQALLEVLVRGGGYFENKLISKEAPQPARRLPPREHIVGTPLLRGHVTHHLGVWH